MQLIKRNSLFIPTKTNSMILKSVSFFILTIFFINLSNAQDKVVIDQVVAQVGKQIILMSDVENQILQLKNQRYYSQGDIKCEVVERMLFSKLLVNQALLDSIEVSDAEINPELERTINGYINQIGSEEKLEAFYKKPMADIKKDFRELLTDQFLGMRMQQQATADLKVTPQEVKSFFKNLPKDSVPMVNTEFEIEQIMVKPEIKESEILRVKDKLREYKDRINKGESMTTLAALYSEDPGSAIKGGDLGFFSRGDMVSEFSAVAFNLKEGETSKIVKTDYGYHIIQLVEKKGERINCRHILLKPKVSNQEKKAARLKLDTIRKEILNKNITFKEACWKYSEDENTRLNGGVMVNPYTENTKWEASQLEPKIAYAISKLEVGDISKPFEMIDEESSQTVIKIVLLKSKTEPHPANLKDDYQRIQDAALEKKRAEFMDDWVAKTIKNTYINIDESYQNCKFNNPAWTNN